MRVFIDLDGSLSNEQIHKEYLHRENLDKIHQDILRRLMKKLEDVSIMSSSSQASNKLSYRITYIDEYCDNVKDLRKVVEKDKIKEIRRVLKNIIPVGMGSGNSNVLMLICLFIEHLVKCGVLMLGRQKMIKSVLIS